LKLRARRRHSRVVPAARRRSDPWYVAGLVDSTTEEIIKSGKSWLDGFIEAEPHAVIALVSLAVVATLYYLWRRLRRRRRNDRRSVE
jgi:hypothetical protein